MICKNVVFVLWHSNVNNSGGINFITTDSKFKTFSVSTIELGIRYYYGYLYNKKDIHTGCLSSRGNRIRTRIYGFGDRRSTIELYPFMFVSFCSRLLYTII